MHPAIPNSSGLPPDLNSILHDLEESDLRARRIAGTLSDVQINWQPNERAWSIAQCLDHLGRGNTIYAAALHQAVQKAPLRALATQRPAATWLVQPSLYRVVRTAASNQDAGAEKDRPRSQPSA